MQKVSDVSSLSEPLQSVEPIVPAPLPIISPPVNSALQLKTFGGFSFDMGICGVNMQDQLVCWGRSSASPKVIAGVNSVANVASSAGRMCVVTLSGQVFCWLTYPIDGTPVEVAGLGKVIQLVASAMQFCTLNDQGKVFCIGSGPTATPPGLAAPVEVPELQGAKKIVASFGSPCAIMPSNGVRCGSTDITQLSEIVELQSVGYANDQICAQDKMGGLKCFTRESESWSAPVAVPGLGPIKTFALGMAGQICASLLDDRIMCVGSNAKFQIDNSGNTFYASPVQVMQKKVKQIYMTHSGVNCILNANNSVQCWGASTSELGFDQVHNYSQPFAFPQLNSIKQIVKIGRYRPDINLFALKNDGRVYCKRMIRSSDTSIPASELCQNSSGDDLVPFYDLKNVVQLIGNETSRICALFQTGKVTCWGDVATDERIPDPDSLLGVIPELQNITQMSSSYDLNCFLNQAGEVYCSVKYYDGTQFLIKRPVKVAGLANVKQVAPAYGGFLALLQDQSVKYYAVVENGAISGSAVSVSVQNVTQVTGVSDNASFYLLKSDGSVWHWRIDVSPETTVAKKIGLGNMKSIESIYRGYVQGIPEDYYDAQICGFDMSDKLKCGGVNNFNQNLTAGLQSPTNYFFGANYVCSVKIDKTECIGEKPYRLLGDTIGLPLQRGN